MDDPLHDLLNELAEFGRSNDAENTDRSRRMLNITPDTGEFLELLVRATASKRVLEIGTSNGYSTVWLAKAIRATGGHVTTLEFSEYKIGLARANFERAGLSPLISLVHTDAGAFINQPALGPFDFIFLDSERTEYLCWWPRLKTMVRVGGLLVVDNAMSHPGEMKDFMSVVRGDTSFLTSLVPVGNGEFLALRVGS
ncbi:MAG: O-methyltransferase [Candidatus Binatia bacterium]